ncbi:MAG: hypothetical protein WBN40_04260, partial [Pseudomonadales bacterium]
IKTHPYEPKKNSRGRAITYEFMQQEYSGNSRVKIVNDFNLASLIKASSYVATLNSQSGIEAALAAKPVLTFGGAFYSGAGFTFDFANINSALQMLREQGIPKVSNEHNERLMEFLALSFESLINNELNEKDKAARAAGL